MSGCTRTTCGGESMDERTGRRGEGLDDRTMWRGEGLDDRTRRGEGLDDRTRRGEGLDDRTMWRGEGLDDRTRRGEGLDDRTRRGEGLDDRTRRGEGLDDRTMWRGEGLDDRTMWRGEGLDDRTRRGEGLEDRTGMEGEGLDDRTGRGEGLVDRTEMRREGLDDRTRKGEGLDDTIDRTAEWRVVPGGHGWVGVGVGVGGVGELMEEKLSVTGVPLPPLPPNTKPLSHQVAGHVYGKSSSRLGMLECGDGTILKPLPEGCCGERELAFYERVWHPHTPNPLHHPHHPLLQPNLHNTNYTYTKLDHLQRTTQGCTAKGQTLEGEKTETCTIPNGFFLNTGILDGVEDGFDLIPLDDENGHNGGTGKVQEEGVRQEGVTMLEEDGEDVKEVLCKAQKLTPVYLGTYIDPATPEVQYLRLGDLTYGFRRPCIADIKIGRRSYDPEATPDKITKELHKYPPQQKLCFQLKGMRSYCRKMDQFTTCSKEYLRCLDEEGVQREGFARFFDNGLGIREDVVDSCIKKLKPIIEWTKQQRLFAFYASSILVIFEGAFDQCDCPNIKEGFQDKTLESASRNSQDISGNYFERDSKGAGNITSAALSWEASKHQIKDGTTSSTSRAGKSDRCSSPKGECHQMNPNISEQGQLHENPLNVSEEEGGRMRLKHSAGPDVRLTMDKSKGCSCKRVEVKMIDFARVFPIDKLDTNYLEGLISLMGHFEQLLEAEQ